MDLSPEERKRIYEEEKARIEAEEQSGKEQRTTGASTTKLESNVAGLLCYLGVWVTGIIFLILEKKDKFVRFHAMQSIIVFGFLAIVSAVLRQLPMVGWFFSVIIGVLFLILWIVLMTQAYRGQLYRIPLGGDLSAKLLAAIDKEFVDTGGYHPPPTALETPPPKASADAGVETRRRSDAHVRSTRSGRVAASSFTIAWSFVFLILFNFFYEYIAYYEYEANTWVRYPVLTGDFSAWLPIITTTLICSIIGHIILITYDRFVLRETTLIVLNLFSLGAVIALLSIFPFDFSAVPNATMVTILPVIVTVVLVGIAIGLGIGTLVSFIKLIANVIKGNTDY